MKNKKNLKLLFIVNPGSGQKEVDYSLEINNFFEQRDERCSIYELPKTCDLKALKQVITETNADRVIAVGGDGTLKLVAECLLHTDTPIGIIPAGSANGMAKELGIPQGLHEALAFAAEGPTKKIHAISVNKELCIHLSDIGFNAYLVKKFDELPNRGMKTYAKAAWQAFWNHGKMDIEFEVKGVKRKEKAAMVVLANATQYGTGLQISPDGKLDDDRFEMILIKDYAVLEILKIWATKLPWNPKKIERFQVSNLTINTKHRVHFQVDGEYLGKVHTVKAHIIQKALTLIT